MKSLKLEPIPLKKTYLSTLLGFFMALTLLSVTLSPVWAEQATLQGSVLKTDEIKNPSINSDDLKTIEKGTDLQMTVSTALSTSATVEGDEFFAKITKDYTVDGQVVIPRGTLMHASVVEAEGPRRAGRKAYISTMFDYMITPDGREIPIEGKFSNKDGKLKSAAKILGKTTGYGAVGGIAGALMVWKYGGLAAVAASEGYALAGGAAIGATAGIATALIKKGKHTLIQPGAELSIKLTEPIVLPSMNIPNIADSNYAPEGLDLSVIAMNVGKDPFGESNEITLSLSMTNQTEHTFTFFDMALEDENGTVFFASPFGDTGMWFQKFKPNSRMVGNLSFSVDNPMLQHHLVFYKRYTREPIAKIAITEKMAVDKKTAKKRMKTELAKHYSHK